MLRSTTFLLVLALSQASLAATLRVPGDHGTIQAALDASQPGDTVLVDAGRYSERIQLRPGVALRSAGDDARDGEVPGIGVLRRATAAILDGGGEAGDQAGVAMAEGSTLDGFTVMNVGLYDEKTWRKHYDSHGELLGDEEGAARAGGPAPAIRVAGVNCTVINNLVHHNGQVGIAIFGGKDRRVTPLIAHNLSYRNLGGGIGVADGAEPVIRANECRENLRAGIGCRNSSPLILDNNCHHNIRAGIGCREGARPIVRGNHCHGNRRAGIGVRMAGTAPVVESNKCYENDMAGIGCRDGAEPVIRNNDCRQNKMAGIGCDGAKPLIVGNECRENEMAGIGLKGKANATIRGNTCSENKLVAIGVTAGSTAAIFDNQLSRTGGVPPLVAVKDGSTASFRNNQVQGGGVAAILVQGKAIVSDNRFLGKAKNQGSAVWVWKGSSATIVDNHFRGYRNAVNAASATMFVAGNSIEEFRGPAIIVRDSPAPAHVFGNTAISKDKQAEVVMIQGPAGVVEGNIVRSGEN